MKEWKLLSYLYTVKIGPKLWMLTEDFTVRTPRGDITVPKGYLTDHASVPRLFHSVCAPAATPVAEAAIIHDWLYNKDSGTTEEYPREFADLCLRELSIANGARRSLAYTVWSAVRAGNIGFLSNYNKKYYYEKLKKMAYKEFQDVPLEYVRHCLGV